MNSFEPKYRQQDVKFVEMSRELTADNYDIQRIIAKIRTIGRPALRILDVGGGIGTVATALAEAFPESHVVVVDVSPLARDNFIPHARTSLVFDDFLSWQPAGTFDVVIFRTVLHHFVAPTESLTDAAQHAAIAKAAEIASPGGKVLVIENFYEPFATEDLTGRLIYALTRSKAIAHVTRLLGANTAGEGVRFRSLQSWTRLFEANAYSVQEVVRAPVSAWYIPKWQRLPLFCADCYQALVELERS